MVKKFRLITVLLIYWPRTPADAVYDLPTVEKNRIVYIPFKLPAGGALETCNLFFFYYLRIYNAPDRPRFPEYILRPL